MRGFLEMRPPHTLLTTPPYTMILVYVVAAMVLLTLVLRFRQYRVWEVALLGGVTLLGTYALRAVQDWLLVMLTVGVPHLAVLLRSWRSKTLARLDTFWRGLLDAPAFRFQWFWPTMAFLLLAVVSLIPPLGRAMPFQENREWPARATDWIEAHTLHGRFFASPNDGAYLIWRLPGQAQSYVDTRGFFFPPELIADSHYLPQLGPDWPQRLRRVLEYGTDYFLLETNGTQGELWHALRPVIADPLYLDETTVLLRADQVVRGMSEYEPYR
jgi:hypothetical protein